MLSDKIFQSADEERLYEFLWWIVERQEIFRKRFIEEQDPPWTDNEILKNYHFCHAFRELDRGSRFLINNIVNRPNDRDVLFNIIVYRLLNLPESYEAAGGFTPVDEFNVDAVVSHLQAYREECPVFSPAYRVSAHKFAGSDSKVENIIRGVVGEVIEDIDYYTEQIQSQDDMEDVHDTLLEIRGIGDFLAYEIATDLSYGFADITENDFVNIGPGAEAGMERIWGDVDKEYIYWVRDNQSELFDHFDLELYSWNGCEWKDLTLRDVEHSLCELNKFRRAKTQDNPNLRKFDAIAGEQLDMNSFK
jgi:hypothetical protein